MKKRSASRPTPAPDDADTPRVPPTPTRPVIIKIGGKPHEPALETSDTPPAPGPSVLRVEGGEKYRLGPLVARGGMGEVRRAEDIACRRIVAIKGMRPAHGLPPELVERFVEEAQVTAQLEHPNIVPVHELGYDVDHNVFYSMKYVKGITLTEVLVRLRKGDPHILEEYSLARLLNILQKVGDAVAFAHSRGLAHCDLKPDNVMICDFGEVLVMDWGLAGAIGSVPAKLDAPAGGASDGHSTSMPILGTPGFIAPERLAAQPAISVAWDVYALGATLYSILALRPPVPSKDVKEALRRAVAGDIVPPAAYNDPATAGLPAESAERPSSPHCPDGRIPVPLSDIAMKAMARDPAGRYATVQDMQADIEAYQNGRIWHTIVDQDFSGPNPLARWEVLAGQHEIRDGTLRISQGEPQMLLYRGDVPGDVKVEFECRQEGRYLNSMGCVIGAVRSQNRSEIPLTGYKFEFGGFDNSLSIIDRTGTHLAFLPRSGIEKGATYRIRAERIGARLRLFVNDEEILSATDPDPLSGADRTAVGLVGWLAETIVTRVKISAMGTPWKSDILDIAERQALKGEYAVATALLKEVIESYPDPVRLSRAEAGLQTARRREQMAHDVEKWRRRLEEAWPGKTIDLRMSNEGLALDLPPGDIQDLSVLQGLPLTSLSIAFNRVRRLEPLRGMPLMSLNCTGNLVTSLEPLRGMKLSVMIAELCPVDDLEPLRGMPLTLVNVGGCRVGDLGPLAGAPLNFLSCWGNRLETVEALEGMKTLTVLYGSANRIESLEPLRGLPIVTTNLSGNRIRSLAPLRGMPLNVLHCGDNEIESLEPLAGMRLKMLSCHANLIRDLRPLKGQPLSTLVAGANRLESLDPFVVDPPDDFRYDSDTLATETIERARETWLKNPARKRHVWNADVLLAIRRNDLDALRAMAATFGGHRYLVIPKFLKWEEAAEFCRRLGGHLVTIRDHGVDEFMNSMLAEGAWLWIGLRTTEQGHEWVTGEPVTYTNFGNLLQERRLGPKIFSGRWTGDDVPYAHNSFVLEWDG